MDGVFTELLDIFPKKTQFILDLKEKLTDECIDDIKILSACSDSFLQSMGMPMGMIIRMREVIVKHTTGPAQSAPSVEPVDVEAYKEAKKAIVDRNSLENIELCKAYILHDQKFTNAPYVLQDKCLKLLERIIKNIINDINDPEIRKIYLDTKAYGNSLGALQCKSMDKFISTIGFEQCDSDSRPYIYISNPSLDKLNKALDVLVKLRSTMTVASVHVKAGSPQASQFESEVSTWHLKNMEEAKRLNELKELHNGGKFVKVDPNPRISYPKTEKEIKKNKKKKNKEDDVDYNPTTRDIQELRGSLQENTTFVNKQKIELDKLKNKIVYQETSLKFILPDKSDLTIQAHPSCPVGLLYILINPYIYNGDNQVSSGDYEIYVTPPVEIMRPTSQKKLIDLGYVPAASFRVRPVNTEHKLCWKIGIEEKKVDPEV